jgi:ABC-type spermidine/putrescine transport system permease subunit I
MRRPFAIVPTAIVLIYWAPVVWFLAEKRELLNTQVLRAYFPYFVTTARVSLIVSLIVVVLTLFNVVFFFRLSQKGRFAFGGVMLLSAFTGLLARNYSWINFAYLLKATGINWPETFLYTETAVVIGMAAYFLPFCFFVMVQGLGDLSDNSIMCAKVLGLDFDEFARGVLIPVLFRAGVISFALVFGLSLGFFATPRMLGAGNVDFASNVVLGYFNKFGDVQLGSAIALWLAAAGAIVSASVVALELKLRRST